MGGILVAARAAAIASAIGVLLAIPACETPNDKLDLATNPSLYATPNYRVNVPANRTAFVAPVVDDRDPVAVEDASGPFPIWWMPEGYWDRPLTVMIHDCLCDAFEQSGVFAGLQEMPPPAADALVVQPSLVSARGGQEERTFGRRSIGTVGIRVVVHGPAAADGSREVLFDEQFDQTVGTDVSTQPQRIPVVFGRALQQAVARILATIDQGNVARSGMPPVEGR